jgi:hypothetical protein
VGSDAEGAAFVGGGDEPEEQLGAGVVEGSLLSETTTERPSVLPPPLAAPVLPGHNRSPITVVGGRCIKDLSISGGALGIGVVWTPCHLGDIGRVRVLDELE